MFRVTGILYNLIKNKNDNIHKNEVQQIRWSDEYSQYRVAANITEYQNQSSKIHGERVIISCKNVKYKDV